MPDYSLPFTPTDSAIEIISAAPIIWIGSAVAFLVVCMLTAHGFRTAISSLTHSVTEWIATRRKTPPDTRTVTLAQLRETSDYETATAEQRTAVGRLDPSVELVHENEFARHAAAVAREIVGDKCAAWPYRHVNLDEAADDLRESYASVKVGPSTYYHAAR